MRTTVRLDNDLMAQAKAYAAAHNQTFTSVLEDALRALLHRHATLRVVSPVKIDVFFGDGLMPGVDLDSGARLQELLDEDEIDEFQAGESDAAA
jgi:hypothetical protein